MKENLAKQLPVEGFPDWLQKRRQQSMSQFVGFPSSAHEDWRNTSWSHLEKDQLQAPMPGKFAQDDQIARYSLNHVGNTCVFFENGFLRTDLTHEWNLPAGVIVTPLAKALREYPDFLKDYLVSHGSENNPFLSLNEALFSDGLLVHVPKGVTVHAPIEVVFYHSAPQVITSPRVILIAEENSRVVLVEVLAGHASGLTNSFTTVYANRASHVEHYCLQEEALDATSVITHEIHQQQDSHYTLNKIALGGRMARLTSSVSLDGPGANAVLNGLYLGEGTQVLDHHIRVDHLKPHGTSHQYFRGALQESSKGLFNDLVVVHQGATKTSAHQSIKNLLLSEKAEGLPEPMLKILNDDVQCSHGAAVGQLDASQLFYLKARGIGEEEARMTLTFAFLNDIIDRIPLASFKSLAIERMVSKFKGNEDAARHFYPCPL